MPGWGPGLDYRKEQGFWLTHLESEDFVINKIQRQATDEKFK